MKKFVKNRRTIAILLGTFFLGLVLRFYNLNWGGSFYFHPDERNIATSISQLEFPSQMNPHFFAYGSFPIYLIYFTKLVVNWFIKFNDQFILSIIISRFYSSILSLFICMAVFLIGKKIFNVRIGVLAALFSIFSVGLIQFAHFGTFEMWLTFLGLILFYLSFKLKENPKLKFLFLSGIVFGTLMAVKVSSLPLVILPVLSLILNLILSYKQKADKTIIFIFLFRLFFILVVSFLTFAIFSPYIYFDFGSFISSISYESSVALGTLPVFYTGEFYGTIPVIFQFVKIYPFIINPVLNIFFPISFIYLLYLGFKRKRYNYLLLCITYLILFVPQAFLFTKWTRYMVPTIPFMYLIAAVFIENIYKQIVKKLLIISLLTIGIIFCSSYFITAFVNKDTRIDAYDWAGKNIPADSKIVSESYDLGTVIFNQKFGNITLFNFYELENNEFQKNELSSIIQNSDYIILPSQRVLGTRLLSSKKFPIGFQFYKDLIEGHLGYKLAYETTCDIFCKVIYLGNPIFSFEQTASVFDRPTVFIFRKV